MPRQMLRIPFGGGLDRASGVSVVDPESAADVRNALLRLGKLQARPGFAEVSDTAEDQVVAAAPYRAQNASVVVTYDEATRAVKVWRAASNGTNPVLVDTWFTAEVEAGRPNVIIAEYYGLIYLAHAHHELKPGSTYMRAPVCIYDGDAGTLADLELDLDGNATPEKVRARGVYTWNNHLWLWGYGTGSDEDRGDIIRHSRPGLHTFNANHYLIAGQKGDPVYAVQAASQVLLVMTESRCFAITGSSYVDFGLQEVDSLFGCVGEKLSVGALGEVFFWSIEGPRRSTGRASMDLSLALDIAGEEPADLPARGEARRGWAVYLPNDRAILFGFPSDEEDATRLYCLSLWDLQNPEWSYWVAEQRLSAAAIFYIGSPGTPPSGQPEYAGDANPTPTGADLTITNSGYSGDEITEIWLQQGAGAWFKSVEIAASGASQNYTLNESALAADTVTNVAYRYRRSGQYNAGAEDASDPSLWPAPSIGDFTTAVGSGAPESISPPPSNLAHDWSYECVPQNPPDILPCDPTYTYTVTWQDEIVDADTEIETRRSPSESWIAVDSVAPGTETVQLVVEDGDEVSYTETREFRVRHAKDYSGTTVYSDWTY